MSKKADWENYPVSDEEMGKRYKNWVESLARQMALIYRVGKEVGGEKFVERVNEEYRKDGERVAGIYMKMLGTKFEDFKDCISLMKIQDLMDDSLANFWDGYVEKSPKAIEKDIKTCPITKQWLKEPDICAVCVHHFLAGMYAAINPKIKVKKFSKLLTKGDNACNLRIEMED